MADDIAECRSYTKGEIVPLMFEVYTESGVPFEIVTDWAKCKVKKNSGELVRELPASLISDEPSKKKFIVSWNTVPEEIGYFLLQVWVDINVTGNKDEFGNYLVEARIASEDLQRYIKEE